MLFCVGRPASPGELLPGCTLKGPGRERDFHLNFHLNGPPSPRHETKQRSNSGACAPRSPRRRDESASCARGAPFSQPLFVRLPDIHAGSAGAAAGWTWTLRGDSLWRSDRRDSPRVRRWRSRTRYWLVKQTVLGRCGPLLTMISHHTDMVLRGRALQIIASCARRRAQPGREDSVQGFSFVSDGGGTHIGLPTTSSHT